MTIATYIALSSFALSLYVAIEQRIIKRKSAYPVFEVSEANLYGDHFSFMVRNRNAEPINITNVNYPEELKVDQPKVKPEEFGAVILEDLGIDDPLSIEVHYKLRHGKDKTSEIKLVRNDQQLYITKQ